MGLFRRNKPQTARKQNTKPGLLKKKPQNVPTERPTLKGILISFSATTLAVCLLLLAALSLTVTAVALVVSMPIFLIFSPVLVPAGITTTLLASGLLAGGISGVTGLTIILRLHKGMTPGLSLGIEGTKDKN